MAAAQKNDVQAVRAALAAGVVPACRDGDRRTPLHFAAGFGNEQVAQVLLDAYASVNAQDSMGITPLWCVASCIAV